MKLTSAVSKCRLLQQGSKETWKRPLSFLSPLYMHSIKISIFHDRDLSVEKFWSKSLIHIVWSDFIYRWPNGKTMMMSTLLFLSLKVDDRRKMESSLKNFVSGQNHFFLLSRFINWEKSKHVCQDYYNNVGSWRQSYKWNRVLRETLD